VTVDNSSNPVGGSNPSGRTGLPARGAGGCRCSRPSGDQPPFVIRGMFRDIMKYQPLLDNEPETHAPVQGDSDSVRTESRSQTESNRPMIIKAWRRTHPRIPPSPSLRVGVRHGRGWRETTGRRAAGLPRPAEGGDEPIRGPLRRALYPRGLLRFSVWTPSIAAVKQLKLVVPRSTQAKRSLQRPSPEGECHATP
jgi:hypothetical protein